MSWNLPRSRQDLIVKELDGELLVYDEDSKKAFCLNGSSAAIWNMCDGQTSIATMVERAATLLALPVDESYVSFALERLERDGLLEPGFDMLPERKVVTRAQLIRRFSRYGIAAAAAIPLIAVVTAPTAAKAYGEARYDHCTTGGTNCSS